MRAQEFIAEIGNTRPEYTRPDKQKSGKHQFTATFTGSNGKQREVDVLFFYNSNTLEINFEESHREFVQKCSSSLKDLHSFECFRIHTK